MGAEGTLVSKINGGEDTMRYFSWEAPTLGYVKCFDTAIFEMTPDGPIIKQQNVAVTRCERGENKACNGCCVPSTTSTQEAKKAASVTKDTPMTAMSSELGPRSGWTVQQAFDHHMKCVFDQDMDTLMQDFNEATHFRLHEYHVDNDEQEIHELSYPDEIIEFYKGLFTAAAEGTLESKINGGEDTMRYFSWEAPTLGYFKCFDTVVFEMTPGGPMIKQQNVEVIKGEPEEKKACHCCCVQ